MSHMSYRATLATVSFGLLLCAASACTTTSSASGAGTDGGITEAGDAGSGEGSGPLTCFGIFQCAADCSATGCEDACVARGTDEAKVAASNVVACYQANACDGGDCLQAKCKAEVSACAALQDPAGKPVDAVPPASARGRGPPIAAHAAKDAPMTTVEANWIGRPPTRSMAAYS